MEKRIKVQFESETFGLEEYETDSVFKSTAWLIAVQNGHEGGLAQEIADLCWRLWLSIDFNEIGEFRIIDYITENYNELPDDFDEIRNDFIEDFAWGV